MMNDSFCRIIAGEIQARPEQVDAAVRLLDEGNTVPFIARYRKEITGGLDDTQLRNLETRLGYLRELEERRQAILKSISEQGKLTDELANAINATLSKTELEDLYLPYKPKRRTRGQIAIEAGLEPLADLLWSDPSHTPEVAAAQYVDADKGVADTKAALDGARYILMERFAEDAALLAKVRDYLWKNAHLVSTVVSGKEEEGAKFRDYFDHHEPLSTVPSHRALAMFRGRNEGVLQLSLNADPQFDEPPKESYCEQIIMDHLGLRLNNAPADSWRKGVVSWTWRIKVLMHLETELMGTVREVYEAIAASAVVNQVAPKWWSPLFPKKLSQTSKEIPMSNQEPATILLIDDHPMLRTGVKQLISMAPAITVVGEASNGEQGIELAESLDPDLILLDLNMPGMNGLETLDKLREKSLSGRIVVFSVSNHEEDVVTALKRGADGYLLKDMEPEDLLKALHQAAAGEMVLSEALTPVLAASLRANRATTERDVNQLTPRERDILKLIAQGLPNKMIARRLDITESTVKVHVKHMLKKMKLKSRVEAAVWVHQERIF